MPTIRAVQPQDLPQLAAMIDRLAAHHGDPPGADTAALQRDLFGPVPWLHGLIVAGAGAGAGYALLLPTAQAQHGTRGLDLHHLYVRRDLRRRGLGRSLVEAAAALVRDLAGSYLTVGTAPLNTEAAAAYAALGFAPRPAGTRFRRDL